MNNLNEQQQRSVSSAFYIIEKSIDDMLHILNNKISESTYEITEDINSVKRGELTEKLIYLKKLIRDISEKYSLKRNILNQSNILNSKLTTWKINIEDILSKSILKKYGLSEFDEEEYDKDLQLIMDFIDSIN